MALVVTGCAPGAQPAADHYASVTADTITRYLRQRVVTPGMPAAQQLASVERWVADPSADYTRSFTFPDVHVIAASDTQVDVVVYETARGEVFEGSGAARGRACVRYTLSAANRLQATSIACPGARQPGP